MAFSLLRVTVNRQRHKAQSDDESCVCARWVATTCLFILFIHFYVLRNVLEHAFPKLVDASCEIHTMNITVDIYFIYCTYFRYFFKILAKTQPILDEIFQ